MHNFTFTVTSLTNTIKNLLENQQTFKGFVLKGEISNFTHHRSGHLYFALKDENAQIRAIMFSTHANTLLFKPKDGDKVTITGSISVYAPQGSYSVQVTSMKLDGAGELYLKYLELKEKLLNLGWFDKPKKDLPTYPKRIGVVTSPTGAVIQDITNTVNRRYKLTEIILYPALVQGPNSATSIASQINKANNDNIVDILIVGRGGGSIEDLWGFNEIEAITAIYHSKIPIITAIGHETDDTISDLVSDLRAPTPTAAAELATPNTTDLLIKLNEIESKNKTAVLNLLSKYQSLLIHHEERLELSNPNKRLEIHLTNLTNLKVNLDNYYKYILESNNKRFDSLKKDLHVLTNQVVSNKQNKYQNLVNILEKVNPLSIMKRGFTITKKNEKIITSANDVNIGDIIDVAYIDGNVKTQVLEKENNNGK